jgi:transposase InsO family protein
LKLLNVIDEFTRERPTIRIERSLNADDVVDCLDRIAMVRGYPVYLRMGNADKRTEFVAAAVRDGANSTAHILCSSAWVAVAKRVDRIIQRVSQP